MASIPVGYDILYFCVITIVQRFQSKFGPFNVSLFWLRHPGGDRNNSWLWDSGNLGPYPIVFVDLSRSSTVNHKRAKSFEYELECSTELELLLLSLKQGILFAAFLKNDAFLGSLV